MSRRRRRTVTLQALALAIEASAGRDPYPRLAQVMRELTAVRPSPALG
jgi:hypothetical protein